MGGGENANCASTFKPSLARRLPNLNKPIPGRIKGSERFRPDNTVEISPSCDVHGDWKTQILCRKYAINGKKLTN